MPNPTDDSSTAGVEGPWPRVTGLDRIFDYGAPWCMNADGHPNEERDYPDPHRHFPPYECRTSGALLEMRDGLDGPARALEIYAAQPYGFGELRTSTARPGPRVVMDVDDDGDAGGARFSLSVGDALRLAAHLTRAVASVGG